MHYVCSCGFTAATATAFYKHLAASKESGAGHQLTQARFSDKPANTDAKSGGIFEPNGQSAPATATWVEEYLMVDQRDTAAHGLSAASQPLQAPLPVSSAPGHPDDVPLREQQGMSRSWGGLGRSRSGAIGRPPVPTAKANAGAAAGATELLDPLLESDEVELVERIRDLRPSDSGASRGAAAATAGNGSGGTATKAALRMSGSVVNAMVVGLSPWRWFGHGNGGVGGSQDGVAAEPVGGQFAELGAQADPLGAPAGGNEATGEVGPSQPHAYPYVLDPPVPSLDAVHAVRDVLIWRNPWRTSRVFGAGLYLAVCVRQLTKGHELLQPTTAIFALCFFLLLRNVVREAASTYRRTQQQQQQQQQGQFEEVHDDAAAAEEDVCSPSQSPRDTAAVERRKAAMLLQQRVEAVLQRVALGAARFGAALVVLGAGLLSGRRAITSTLVAGLLWLGMVVGELRLISQPMFWLLCYVAAFAIPAAYYRCRGAMDAGVEAALRFVVRVLVSGSRVSLLTSAGVAAVLVVALPLNLVLRATLAAAAAFVVLLWQSGLGAQGQQAAWAGWAQLPGGGERAQAPGGWLPAA